MAKTLQQIIGWEPLTEALRTQTDGIPNPLPPELFTVNPANRVLGERAKYIKISGQRQPAFRVPYGAPPIKRNLKDISEQPLRLLHFFEEFNLPVHIVDQLRSFEAYTQDQGVDYLAYQIKAAAQRPKNTLITATASVLRHGKIYFDSAGEILADSSGADSNLTIDFSVPATHQNQINSILTVSWSVNTADIPGNLAAIDDFAAKETGLELKTALYGRNVRKYMQENNTVQAYLARNPTWSEKWLSSRAGQIPDGLFGFRWIPVHSMFFESTAGTNTSIWDDDLLVLMPDISQPDKMTWWAMMEGSYRVPKSYLVSREAMGMVNNFEVVYGDFAFGYMDTKPPFGINFAHGATYMPVLRNGSALYQIDTNF